MTDDADPLPGGALDDVAFLARSPNRVLILRTLAAGPVPRREAASDLDVSRTTLDRIVNELEDRGWAERTPDGEYVATPRGAHLVAALDPFLQSVAAIHTLGEAVDWLPTEEMDIRLEHFADASVREPSMDDPVETVEFMTDLARGASTFRALTHLVPPEPLDVTILDGVRSGRLEAEGVMTTQFLEFLRNHEDRRARWRAGLKASGILYTYDGELPCNLWIADDTVLLKKSGPGPIPESYGIPIVSENDAVRSWAMDLFDRYRRKATPVEPADLAEPAGSTSGA